MINQNLLAAVDSDLSEAIGVYLKGLLEDSFEGGSKSEYGLILIGTWVVENLQYPLSVENPQMTEPIANKKPRPKRDYRQVILERDGFKCCQCSSESDLTVDHIIPISKGGKTNLRNLQTLCRKCNSVKGSSNP